MSVSRRERLTVEQMLQIVRNGLPPAKQAHRIVIVGAGLAGLVTGSLLKAAGHRIVILEANDRVGGRVQTIRAPFREGLYAEAGAMRIPEQHVLVFEYIKKYKLNVQLFLNETENDLLYVNGIKKRANSTQVHPDELNYPLAEREKGKTVLELLTSAMGPLLTFVQEDPAKHWPVVLREYDRYSISAFLKNVAVSNGNANGHTLSPGAVEAIDVLLDFEGFLQASLIETLLFLMQMRPDGRLFEIVGGSDLLPLAFGPELEGNLLLNHRMVKMAKNGNGVDIFTLHRDGQTYRTSGDFAVVTLPFSTLRLVQIEPPTLFSHEKRKAIRELHYMSATKILIEFKSRFWEKEGQCGGKSVTDLPLRFTYYPSIGIGTDGPAILLASYTWGDDTVPWDGLCQEERIAYALRELAILYGNQVYREFIRGTTHSWAQDPYASGVAAFLSPGQYSDLFPHVGTPEGNVYFAGEHTTYKHGWMEGAVESGIQAAYDVHAAGR